MWACRFICLSARIIGQIFFRLRPFRSEVVCLPTVFFWILPIFPRLQDFRYFSRPQCQTFLQIYIGSWKRLGVWRISKPWSDKDENSRRERSPSELAGPANFKFIKAKFLFKFYNWKKIKILKFKSYNFLIFKVFCK